MISESFIYMMSTRATALSYLSYTTIRNRMVTPKMPFLTIAGINPNTLG